MIARLLPLFLLSLLISACKQNQPAPEAKEPPKVEEAKAEEAKPEDARDASTASVEGKSDPACIGPIGPGEVETVTLGERSFERNGHLLRIQGEAEEGAEHRIGVLANLNASNPENHFNIRRYLGRFEEAGVELILVAGDTGEDAETIAKNLAAVAGSGLPTLAIAGNREKTADFVAAVAKVQAEHPNLLSGHQIRQLGLHGLDVITLPGYHDPRYIHQEEGTGCRYFLDDVNAVEKLAAEASKPVLLLAHGQPKGRTPEALDVIAPDKEHIGDQNLNRAIEKAKIPFGIFANVKEAGGKGLADLGGAKVVPAGEWSETLYLNPGPADSLAWNMNDGTTSHGMAAILKVKEGKASYEIIRAPQLTDADKEEAAKLAAD